MNSKDWFRKNLKFRVQQRLHQPTRYPRLRKVLVTVVDRVMPGVTPKKKPEDE